MSIQSHTPWPWKVGGVNSRTIHADKYTASELAGFSSFEQVREAFRWGFMMPDGCMANAIGRCKDKADFLAKAKHGNWTVLE